MKKYKKLALIKGAEILLIVAYLLLVNNLETLSTGSSAIEAEILSYAPYFLIFALAITEFFIVPKFLRKNTTYRPIKNTAIKDLR